MKTPNERTFGGFPHDALAFYRELEGNNTRQWFENNKARYQASVLEPARVFVAELGTRLQALLPRLRWDAERINGSGSIFRIQRDVRFSKDKRPYKTNLGMLFWLDDGRSKRLCPHFYVGLYPRGGFVHAGLKSMPAALLRRYRKAVAELGEGERLRTLLEELQELGLSTGALTLKRVPRPYPADHPQATLLRYSGVFAETGYLADDIVTSSDLIDECLERCTQLAPLVEWLSASLGKG